MSLIYKLVRTLVSVAWTLASLMSPQAIAIMITLIAGVKTGVVQLPAAASVIAQARTLMLPAAAEAALLSPMFTTSMPDDANKHEWVRSQLLTIARVETGDEAHAEVDALAGVDEKAVSDVAQALIGKNKIADDVKGAATIADTGASIPFFQSRVYFDKSTMKPANIKVNGVAGQHAIREKGDASQIVVTYGDRFEDNGFAKWVWANAALNESCSYNLAPIAAASSTHRTSLWLPPDGCDGYVGFPSGKKVRLFNKKVTILHTSNTQAVLATLAQPVLPDDEPLCFVGGVIQGKRTTMSHLSPKIIHSTFGHLPYRRQKHLPDCLADFPKEWASMIQECVCDICLRADAPQLGPTGSFDKHDGLVAFDVWHTRSAFVHGGQRLVCGFTLLKSKLRKSYRMSSHHDSITCIRAALVWFNARLGKRDLKVTHAHADRAFKLTQDHEAHKVIKGEFQCYLTTSPPKLHRASPQEGTWKELAKGTRKLMYQGNITDPETMILDSRWWGYAWDEYEALLAICPGSEAPWLSPYEQATGEKPKGAMRRPWGCLCYINDPRYDETDKGNKVTTGAPTALRALHLGYNHEQCFGPMQLRTASNAYVCYCAELGRVVVTTNVRFVPDCFPGLTVSKQGGRTVQ